MIRCFIAIQIPQEIKFEIESYLSQLKRISPSIRWVKITGLHITLKFLGEIEKDLLDKIRSSLKSISNIFQPFDISIMDCGTFPNKKRPRIIWLGIEPDADNMLIKIYQWLEESLVPFGFEKEQRKFTPHLTIGRIKFPDNMDKLLGFIEKEPFPKKQFSVEEIVLMQSILKPTGAEYQIIDKYY